MKSLENLGVCIDKVLIYEVNFEHRCDKVAKRCGFLKYISSELNVNFSLLRYIMYIKPLISHGILVYCFLPKTFIKPTLFLRKQNFRYSYEKEKNLEPPPDFLRTPNQRKSTNYSFRKFINTYYRTL